jgi:hypothetical protein
MRKLFFGGHSFAGHVGGFRRECALVILTVDKFSAASAALLLPRLGFLLELDV